MFHGVSKRFSCWASLWTTVSTSTNALVGIPRGMWPWISGCFCVTYWIIMPLVVTSFSTWDVFVGEVRMGFVYERSNELAKKMIKVDMTTANSSQNGKNTIVKAIIWEFGIFTYVYLTTKYQMMTSFARISIKKNWETLRKSYIRISWLAKPGADEISQASSSMARG